MSDNSKTPVKAVRRPVSRKDMTKLQWTWKEIKRNYHAYIMALPYFLIFFTFTVGPVILSIYYSFTVFNLIEDAKFVFIKTIFVSSLTTIYSLRQFRTRLYLR